MRRRAKVDANQSEIVDALRKTGATVQSLATVGSGVPDLLVGRGGQTYLLEVKDGRRVPSERRLTEDERGWHSTWRGFPVSVVNSTEEALKAVGVVTSCSGCDDPTCRSQWVSRDANGAPV